MTRDEAHSRALEAGLIAQQNARGTFQEMFEAGVTAYLAAMVLPISERNNNMETACISMIGGQWVLLPPWVASHFFFLPKVTK